MFRNLQDALNVARNILLEGRMVPGGGAAEMAVAARLHRKAKSTQLCMHFFICMHAVACMHAFAFVYMHAVAFVYMHAVAFVYMRPWMHACIC